MKLLVAIVADIDGTLIEGGNIASADKNLKKAVKRVREKRILFSLGSGRTFLEQEAFHNLLIAPDHYTPGEAILYEGSCLRFLGGTTVYRLGGLTREQITEVELFAAEKKLFSGLVHRAGNETYETGSGYVTPTFIHEGRTDRELLKETYRRARPILEDQFSFLSVSISADGLDLTAKGVTKANPLRRYAELTGISLDEIAVFGDSSNDMLILELVGKAGGLPVYVGNNPEQEALVRSYPRYFIPEQRGVKGSIEALQNMLSSI